MAKGEAILTNGVVTGITIIDGGSRYCHKEHVRTSVIVPKPRQAVVSASTSTETGAVTSINFIDTGSGYSSGAEVKICFPIPPEPDIVAYDLVLDPVETYDTVNNGHYHESISLPSECIKADIFNVNQTKLFNQYKTHSWYLTGNDPETNLFIK